MFSVHEAKDGRGCEYGECPDCSNASSIKIFDDGGEAVGCKDGYVEKDGSPSVVSAENVTERIPAGAEGNAQMVRFVYKQILIAAKLSVEQMEAAGKIVEGIVERL